MKEYLKLLSAFLFAAVFSLSSRAAAKWIAPSSGNADAENTWVMLRKDAEIGSLPQKAVARIATDTKYWLWINGKMAVFEGGLKRGPTPRDTYCDEVDIAPFLKKGVNKIAVLAWHFGKEGFSHKDSGRFGFFFGCGALGLQSDSSWSAMIHPAYGTAEKPKPNFRLPESNIKFDANKDIPDWQTAEISRLEKCGFANAVEIGKEGDAPWNALCVRPIPQWRLFDVKRAAHSVKRDGKGLVTVNAVLPYNMQMTPIIELEDSSGGSLVEILTDHTYSAGETNLRAEYITKKGFQRYESLGWLSGQRIILKTPESVRVRGVYYRESGFDTRMSGVFECSDPFLMRFFKKAQNTLYINMRDTFFDCPERERAQWWGDTVILSEESFYMCSTSVNALVRKAIRELCDWQKPDGTLFSPIPAGNYDTELPGQMLASIGLYGFWNYYMNTGDGDTIEYAYPAVKKYLSLWSCDSTGLTAFRAGGWSWGDWGDNRDQRLILAAWHYIALESAAKMAELLQKPAEAAEYRAVKEKVKSGFEKCWNGAFYRHPDYKQKTDDRVQALAVVSGLADASKYPAIRAFLRENAHASPYMEKYVMEALIKMGDGAFALSRVKKRYAPMVNDKYHTTLFEGWDEGTFGGGSTNHAWSGGPIGVLAHKVCGVYPVEAGWRTFAIAPQTDILERASIAFQSVAGVVKSAFVQTPKKLEMEISVPKGTCARLILPEFANGKKVSVNGVANVRECPDTEGEKRVLALGEGAYKIKVE